MTKIAFFITSKGWGGLEMNTLKLASSLIKLKYDVTLYTIDSSKIYAKALQSKIPMIIINQPKKYIDIRNAYNIGNLLKSNGHNIIFLFYNRDIEIIAQCKRLFYHKLIIVYEQHMQIGISKKDIIHRIRYSYIDYWISPLNFLKKQVIDKTTVPEKKIRVIPLGLDTKRFINRKYSKEEARKILKINTTGILIGTIGRIEEKKGQDFLVKAIIELRKRYIDTELLIFGSPTINDESSLDYFGKLREFVKSNEMENICHFIEHNEQSELFYCAADIFALASHSETYGMVTIEAMLSGIPIVATNSSGTPEILNNGEFGKLYQLNDIDDFCNKIVAILQNPDTTKSMIAKARSHAIEYYSVSTEVNLVNKLIEEITV